LNTISPSAFSTKIEAVPTLNPYQPKASKSVPSTANVIE